jgi:predicted RNA-binding Zn-ribbon protein involved in translation (DUF1610 family)
MTYCDRCKYWSPGKKVLMKKTDVNFNGQTQYICPECGFVIMKNDKVKTHGRKK